MKLTATHLKLIIVTMLWGLSFIAGRIVAQELSPMWAAWCRFAIASGLLVMLVWRAEGRLPRLTRQQVQATFGLGATGIFLYNVCFFKALSLMPAGRTALFVAMNPIITALASAWLFRERLSMRRWCGIALAFIGAAIVITKGELFAVVRDISRVFGLGEIAMLCAATAWAAYTILGKHALKGLSPLIATCYASLWGWMLLSFGLMVELPEQGFPHLTPTLLLLLAVLGALCTVLAYIWYAEGVKAIGPARTAVFNNLVPVFGVLFSALLLHEPVLPSMVLGGVLAITGVMLTNR